MNSVPYIQQSEEGQSSLHLMVENVHCAGCIGKIERALHATPGVVSARVNMSTRRLNIKWQDGEASAEKLMNKVNDLGYPVAPFNPEHLLDGGSKEDKKLLSALAVAGFAAGNVMLLSVSVWSGHFSDMGDATRGLFHWISALIALPAVIYSGMPFFKSAFRALAGGATNMDVPISLAVLLASAMSLQQTIVGGTHAYFDAAITLLFFLLIGRYLDRRARAKARSAAERLLSLQSTTATIVNEDGETRVIETTNIQPGMVILVSAGERLPIDGVIINGSSDIDSALVTGESLPRQAGPDDTVFAGTINLSQPIQVRVTAAGESTLLSEIVRLMEASEQGRAKYVRLADRIARIYAPTVHILAAGTFIGWMFFGFGWQDSLMAAIAVLIITCPCALGLAVPVVQVIASGRLLQQGILVKTPDALERLEAIDTVVFDKTGTLTRGELTLVNSEQISEDTLGQAASLAAHSNHPLSKAIVRAASSITAKVTTDVQETPGRGLAGCIEGQEFRLGSADWCGIDNAMSETLGPEIWLSGDSITPQRFQLSDTLRPDACELISTLQLQGLQIELLSGDREDIVKTIARETGISEWRAGCLPDQKVERLKELAKQGRKVLMVGDGLNDAPALAAGHASISPASAADISQTAADLIFQGQSLLPVFSALTTAKNAGKLVRQNFALAFLYNTIAVPIAVIGLVTPLIAAIAMSSSSLVVILNALRLKLQK